MKFYFFEVTNPREVEAGLERPRLLERGPYSYLQYRRKVNISKEWEGKDKIRYEDFNMSKIKGARTTRYCIQVMEKIREVEMKMSPHALMPFSSTSWDAWMVGSVNLSHSLNS